MTPQEQKAFDQMREALEAAISAHNRMLMSNPPQSAWDYYHIEDKASAALTAAKEVQKPDRTGMTYYKNNDCKAERADAPDCICWTPKAKEVQAQVETTDCYGDGTVYRGVRSKDSIAKTIHVTIPQAQRLSNAEIESCMAIAYDKVQGRQLEAAFAHTIETAFCSKNGVYL